MISSEEISKRAKQWYTENCQKPEFPQGSLLLKNDILPKYSEGGGGLHPDPFGKFDVVETIPGFTTNNSLLRFVNSAGDLLDTLKDSKNETITTAFAYRCYFESGSINNIYVGIVNFVDQSHSTIEYPLSTLGKDSDGLLVYRVNPAESAKGRLQTGPPARQIIKDKKLSIPAVQSGDNVNVFIQGFADNIIGESFVSYLNTLLFDSKQLTSGEIVELEYYNKNTNQRETIKLRTISYESPKDYSFESVDSSNIVFTSDKQCLWDKSKNKAVSSTLSSPYYYALPSTTNMFDYLSTGYTERAIWKSSAKPKIFRRIVNAELLLQPPKSLLTWELKPVGSGITSTLRVIYADQDSKDLPIVIDSGYDVYFKDSTTGNTTKIGEAKLVESDNTHFILEYTDLTAVLSDISRITFKANSLNSNKLLKTLKFENTGQTYSSILVTELSSEIEDSRNLSSIFIEPESLGLGELLLRCKLCEIKLGIGTDGYYGSPEESLVTQSIPLTGDYDPETGEPLPYLTIDRIEDFKIQIQFDLFAHEWR